MEQKPYKLKLQFIPCGSQIYILLQSKDIRMASGEHLALDVRSDNASRNDVDESIVGGFRSPTSLEPEARKLYPAAQIDDAMISKSK